MRITTVTDDVLILLGKQGEINAQEIRFPVVDSWQNTYGANGTFSMLLQRPTENAPYPKSCTIADGCVCIAIDNADNALAGIGLLELQYIVNGNLAKSHTWQTKVFECLGTAGEPPEPWESWVDEVLQAASDASESAESASQSAEDADGYAEDSEAWAVGQRDGSDVPSTDPAYHNNAKYYASQYIGRHGTGEHAETFNCYEDDFPEDYNRATGDFSHAEGGRILIDPESQQPVDFPPVTAAGDYSHAEGGSTTASGRQAHAEGCHTIASGVDAHAEGDTTQALHNASHAGGAATITGRPQQTVIGKYNSVSSDALFAVGNGTANAARKNAFVVNADGTASVQRGFNAGSGTQQGRGDQCVVGKYNVDDNSSLFVVGAGTDDANRRNVFTVDPFGNVIITGRVTGSADDPTLSNELTRKGYTDKTYVAKVTAWEQLYGTNGAGAQITIPYSKYAIDDTVAVRETDGKLRVGTPTDSVHATTKSYVDDNFAPKATNGYVEKMPSTDRYKVYVNDGIGKLSSLDYAKDSAKANAVAVRNANGQIFCEAPTADKHAANKKYVSDNFAPKATNGYVEKTNQLARLHGTGLSSTAETAIPYGTSPSANTIAMREAGGALYVGPPTDRLHAATKEYVNDRVQANPTATGTETQLERIKIGNTNYTVGGASALVVSLINTPSYVSYAYLFGGFVAHETVSYESQSQYTDVSVSDICEFVRTSGGSGVVLRIPNIDTIFDNGVPSWDSRLNGWSFPSKEVILSLATVDYDAEDVKVSFAGTLACEETFADYPNTRVYNICVELADNSTEGHTEITIKGINVKEADPQPAPCLIEGTKIELNDGTSINVEDLRKGMVVKSYDVNTKEIVPAVVIDSYETGRSREFTSYVFDNGSYVICYGQHGFYHYGDGIIRNVEDMKLGISGVSSDLSHPKYLRKYPLHIAGESKRRFNIVTSNSLYFANGILMGLNPIRLYNYFENHPTAALTETLKATIDEVCAEFNRHSYDVLTNPDFYNEISKDSMDIARAKVRIKRYKARLADTDYLTTKFTEGKLSAEAFELAKVERQHWRDLINEEEQIIADSTAAYEAVVAKYRNTARTKREVYEYAWGLLNGKYENFNEAFGNEEV